MAGASLVGSQHSTLDLDERHRGYPQWVTSSRLLRLGEAIDFDFFFPDGTDSEDLVIFERYLERAEPGEAFSAGGDLSWLDGIEPRVLPLEITGNRGAATYCPEQPGSYLARWRAGGETLYRYFAVIEDHWAVVRFSTSVRKPCSTTPSGLRCSKSRTNSRVGVNSAIRATRLGPWRSAARQNAATSWSSSTSIARSAKSSMIAVSDTIAPPANGSMSILGRVRDSQARMCGTSHVLPPGYRSGLRCGTCATLTAGMRLTGYGIS